MSINTESWEHQIIWDGQPDNDNGKKNTKKGKGKRKETVTKPQKGLEEFLIRLEQTSGRVSLLSLYLFLSLSLGLLLSLVAYDLLIILKFKVERGMGNPKWGR